MTSRIIDDLASQIDDASQVVDELQSGPPTGSGEKLQELRDALKEASNTIEELVDPTDKDS